MLVREAAAMAPSWITADRWSSIRNPSDTKIIVFGPSIVFSAVSSERSTRMVPSPAAAPVIAFSCASACTSIAHASKPGPAMPAHSRTMTSSNTPGMPREICRASNVEMLNCVSIDD